VFAVLLVAGVGVVKKMKKQWLGTLGLMTILLAITFTGRTGLILVLLSPLFFVFTSTMSRGSLAPENSWDIVPGYWRLGQIFLGVVITIACLIILWFIVIPLETREVFVEVVFPWVFEFLYQAASGEGLGTASTTAIKEMYFLPENTVHLFFGTSNAGRGLRLAYIPSDVGYIRAIFAVGIIGLILMYVPYMYMLIQGLKNFRKSPLAAPLIYYCFAFFIANFKEMHFVPRGGCAIIFLLFIAVLVKSSRNTGMELVT
jgi:hypothetical protein